MEKILTVVVPTYNAEKYLRDNLESFEIPELMQDIEILIVNDGSTDRSLEIAREYEQAGADCVSVLTEPKWFLGSDEIFKEIRAAIALPMIRKDFTVDAYQIYEAKCMGADAVLLICALLPTETIREYLKICDDLGLTALVETHDENEIQSALKAGARVLGVNNRNLKNFTVDFSNAANLREQIPANVIFVAESGVKEP